MFHNVGLTRAAVSSSSNGPYREKGRWAPEISVGNLDAERDQPLLFIFFKTVAYVVVAILNHANAGADAARAPLDALLQWVARDAANARAEEARAN